MLPIILLPGASFARRNPQLSQKTNISGSLSSGPFITNFEVEPSEKLKSTTPKKLWGWVRQPILNSRPVAIESGIRITNPVSRSDDVSVRLPPPDINEWLELNPRVSHAITWVDPRARTTETLWPSWSSWSSERKESLRHEFVRIWNWYQDGRAEALDTFQDPIPFRMTPSQERSVGSPLISQEDAWTLYITCVAHSLVLELRHEVSWSITEYSNDSLMHLLGAQKMFEWASGYQQFFFANASTPAPPTWVLEHFFRANSLLRSTKRDTVAALLEWANGHLRHYMDYPTFDNRETVWQYRGHPPVSRVISGTVDSRVSSDVLHYTEGCMGTVAFFISVLRSVNIPADVERTAEGHWGLFLSSEALHLFHGDDPHAATMYSTTSPIPMEALLVDQVTYDRWTREMKNSAARLNDVTIRYLPEYILMSYCQDRAEHLSNNCSRVAFFLSGTYTPEQLEGSTPSENLWNRMNDKVESMGGCDHIPDPFPHRYIDYRVMPAPTTCLP